MVGWIENTDKCERPASDVNVEIVYDGETRKVMKSGHVNWNMVDRFRVITDTGQTEEKIIGSVRNIPVDQLLTLEYFQNRGVHFLKRALVNDETGKRELAFSDTIKAHHEESGCGINHLTEGDEKFNEIAFSVFQWLTTNVGSAVLDEALKKTGQRIVPL